MNFIKDETHLGLSSMSSPWPLIILATSLPLYAYFRSTRSKLPLPPSPPKHWIRGNADQLSLPHRYVVYATEYKEKYGDIISLTTPNETQIILNTAELASELLDKQSAHTSDRIYNVMANDIMDWGASVGFYPYDERLKKARRVIASALHITAAKSYAPQHYESTLDLIHMIIANPNDYQKHINWVTGAFILRLTYGYNAIEDDPVLNVVRMAISYLGKALTKLYWVNYFPALKHVPAWVPGAGFQLVGREGRYYRNRMVNELFDDVYDQVRHGQVKQPSYTSKLLEAKGGAMITEEDASLIRITAGSMYTDVFIQTVALVVAFILEMALHPEIAKAARAEIDSVVGRDRLPMLPDREKLPFFDAVLLEVMRLWPPSPIGVAHRASREVEFRGYRIPKDAAIFSNIWAITRDPALYSSPHAFNPERFTKPLSDSDPRKYIFGFGKRICPGVNVANNSTFIMCAGLLSVFDMVATPELAAEIEALGGRSSFNLHKLSSAYSLVTDILPFSVTFRLRDAAAAALVEGAHK
ncbi:cytochrome P450 family protein [Ceratobasidium sp. AG-Ba]|nr:cytochrome P450 family protein [Ceratobasidium sp. AG-Ba]QRW02430.1 cytochrome P450 family protein [Ceratobasidium sp. AG-Ba]